MYLYFSQGSLKFRCAGFEFKTPVSASVDGTVFKIINVWTDNEEPKKDKER